MKTSTTVLEQGNKHKSKRAAVSSISPPLPGTTQDITDDPYSYGAGFYSDEENNLSGEAREVAEVQPINKATQSINKSSGFRMQVCCNIVYCGFPFVGYGQYILPEEQQEIVTKKDNFFDDDFGFGGGLFGGGFATNFHSDVDKKEPEKPYEVNDVKVGSCDLCIPCGIFSFGCPAYEYKYKDTKTGYSILPLPQITEAEALKNQNQVIEGTVSTRKVALKICCIGPSINIATELGFFSSNVANANQNQAPNSKSDHAKMIR